jgi:hypothetical protein
MTEQPNLTALASEIRRIHASSGRKAAESIEACLKNRLGSLAAEERMDTLEKLVGFFKGSTSGPALPVDDNQEIVARLFSLILGKPVQPADLSSSELLQRLAESLNTIFDTLNRLVGLIQSTFSAQADPEETIRQVIGIHLEGEDRTESLEAYLGQISQAFLLAQEAFKKSGHKLIGDILDELDPAKLDRSETSSLKFGPLRKAELFDRYTRKLEQCRSWYESGRFMADLQREFEKNCQQRPL